MEFCSKCGKLLTPSPSKEGGVLLTCKACGYVKAVKEPCGGYVWTERIEGSRRRRAVVVEGSPILEKRRKEEHELAQEYYEVFLESYSEAAEEGEEE
jgi:DNA-directed RNA polymerase subunit M/transcription elongation factor TFIIS